MVDSDLALLYDVPTKALKQQVKRNNIRFPEDFMFELSINEIIELVTNCDRLSFLKHSSVNPMVAEVADEIDEYILMNHPARLDLQLRH